RSRPWSRSPGPTCPPWARPPRPEPRPTTPRRMTEPASLLSNPRSERVRQVAALGRRAARARTGTFLVEGPQAVRELLGHAVSSAAALYVTHAAGTRHADVVARAGEARVPV